MKYTASVALLFASGNACRATRVLVAWAVLCFGLPGNAQQPSNASVQGFALDSNRSPVAGALISLRPSGNLPALSTHTDTQGRYLFASVPPGSYTLLAEKPGFAAGYSAPFQLGEKEARKLDLTLAALSAAGQQSTSLPLDLYEKPHFTVSGVTQATGSGGHGSGEVMHKTQALADATVSLTHEDDDSRILPADQTRVNANLSQPNKPELHHQLARAAEKKGDALAAVREYETAAQMDPSEPNLFDWATELLAHHAPGPALEVFLRGHRRAPESARMLLGLGAAQFAVGTFDDAARSVFAASDLNPSDPTPYLFLGKMLGGETSLQAEFSAKLRRFATLQPANALANYYYALSLEKLALKNGESAASANIESLLQQAVHLDSQLGVAWLQLGSLYYERGDFAQSIVFIKQALHANPELEEAHYRLARAYKRGGDSAKAAEHLRLFQQLTQEHQSQADQKRAEILQFVVMLRDGNPAPQQP